MKSRLYILVIHAISTFGYVIRLVPVNTSQQIKGAPLAQFIKTNPTFQQKSKNNSKNVSKKQHNTTKQPVQKLIANVHKNTTGMHNGAISQPTVVSNLTTQVKNTIQKPSKSLNTNQSKSTAQWQNNAPSNAYAVRPNNKVITEHIVQLPQQPVVVHVMKSSTSATKMPSSKSAKVTAPNNSRNSNGKHKTTVDTIKEVIVIPTNQSSKKVDAISISPMSTVQDPTTTELTSRIGNITENVLSSTQTIAEISAPDKTGNVQITDASFSSTAHVSEIEADQKYIAELKKLNGNVSDIKNMLQNSLDGQSKNVEVCLDDGIRSTGSICYTMSLDDEDGHTRIEVPDIRPSSYTSMPNKVTTDPTHGQKDSEDTAKLTTKHKKQSGKKITHEDDEDTEDTAKLLAKHKKQSGTKNIHGIYYKNRDKDKIEQVTISDSESDDNKANDSIHTRKVKHPVRYFGDIKVVKMSELLRDSVEDPCAFLFDRRASQVKGGSFAYCSLFESNPRRDKGSLVYLSDII